MFHCNQRVLAWVFESFVKLIQSWLYMTRMILQVFDYLPHGEQAEGILELWAQVWIHNLRWDLLLDLHDKTFIHCVESEFT